MKKFIVCILFIVMVVMASTAVAGGRVRLATGATADVSAATALMSDQHSYRNNFLYTYDIKCTLDDVVVLTIISPLGTPYESVTTSAATTGEADNFEVRWKLTGTETYTLTGIGSGSCNVDIYLLDP